MPRTVTYFTGISGSETIFFTNEDTRPAGLTNVKKVGQKVFSLQYHEISDYPEALALWQLDGNLSGSGPEADDMEVLGGAAERYGPGPAFGRKAFFGDKNRSLRMLTVTSSLQLSSSVTVMMLYYPHETVITNDGAGQQALFQIRGLNSSNTADDNALMQCVHGETNPGIGHFYENGAGTNNQLPFDQPQYPLLRKWNHLAASINSDGTARKVYVNGKVVQSWTGITSADGGTNARPRILGPQTNDVGQAAGYICSVLIVGKQLSDNEVFKAAKRTLGDSI